MALDWFKNHGQSTHVSGAATELDFKITSVQTPTYLDRALIDARSRIMCTTKWLHLSLYKNLLPKLKKHVSQ